jgi:hypothetical protein
MTGSITEQGLLTFLLARVIILARPTPWKGNYDALDHERKVVKIIQKVLLTFFARMTTLKYFSALSFADRMFQS